MQACLIYLANTEIWKYIGERAPWAYSRWSKDLSQSNNRSHFHWHHCKDQKLLALSGSSLERRPSAPWSKGRAAMIKQDQTVLSLMWFWQALQAHHVVAPKVPWLSAALALLPQAHLPRPQGLSSIDEQARHGPRWRLMAIICFYLLYPDQVKLLMALTCHLAVHLCSHIWCQSLSKSSCAHKYFPVTHVHAM